MGYRHPETPIERRRRLDRTRTKISDTSNVILVAIVVIVFAVAIGGCNFWLRNKTITDCENRGGQAITHPWYQSGDSNGNGGYFDVTCLEPRNGLRDDIRRGAS